MILPEVLFFYCMRLFHLFFFHMKFRIANSLILNFDPGAVVPGFDAGTAGDPLVVRLHKLLQVPVAHQFPGHPPAGPQTAVLKQRISRPPPCPLPLHILLPAGLMLLLCLPQDIVNASADLLGFPDSDRRAQCGCRASPQGRKPVTLAPRPRSGSRLRRPPLPDGRFWRRFR